MMASQLRGAGQALGLTNPPPNSQETTSQVNGTDGTKRKLELRNRAGESKSPYVKAHGEDPVKWQIWGDEAIEMAKRENRLLFVSIGYNACHWCHVMHHESFLDPTVADQLNTSFIPIKIDREERPDIDRIYMNFVQATTGSGGWPLNVFLTPSLEPVFGGTYWPGPSSSSTTTFEDQVDFLGILGKLATVWKEQEQRCRMDSSIILKQLKEFAAEGTHGGHMHTDDHAHGLDIELLEEATQHFGSTYDIQNGGFGHAPKFPTPSKLSFLLRLGQYPAAVIDVVGAADCHNAQTMAITTLRKMARGGIHDHIGEGFARYSVTADWSLPHFEKMLYDNAQLLHIYLDSFLLSRDHEMLGVVYDIATYLTTTLAHPEGGFYSSEDADSLYRPHETEKREGAYYVWTHREFESLLGNESASILGAFFNVSPHGNVEKENDPHDEFIDQNVLAIVKTPNSLATQFGMKEEEIVRIIKEGKSLLRKHREKERVRPSLDDKIITSWNGIAIGALARTGAVLKGFDPVKSEEYLGFATKAAKFVKKELWDGEKGVLYRVYKEGRGDVEGFADDYAFLIEGLIDLYEATFEEKYLEWADKLQKSQNSLFSDSLSGGYFSTPSNAAHTILRLKDGMDTAEPSTNGISASNLYRLSSLLNDESYSKLAKGTVHSFEAEMMQYPWLFGSFMPSVVAGQMGIRGVVVSVPEIVADSGVAVAASETTPPAVEQKAVERVEKIKEFEKAPRGGLQSFIRLTPTSNPWLRERNSLLKDVGLNHDTSVRIIICENGVCKEEREAELKTGEIEVLSTSKDKDEEKPGQDSALDLKEIEEALPSSSTQFSNPFESHTKPASEEKADMRKTSESETLPELEKKEPEAAEKPVQEGAINLGAHEPVEATTAASVSAADMREMARAATGEEIAPAS